MWYYHDKRCLILWICNLTPVPFVVNIDAKHQPLARLHSLWCSDPGCYYNMVTLSWQQWKQSILVGHEGEGVRARTHSDYHCIARQHGWLDACHQTVWDTYGEIKTMGINLKIDISKTCTETTITIRQYAYIYTMIKIALIWATWDTGKKLPVGKDGGARLWNHGRTGGNTIEWKRDLEKTQLKWINITRTLIIICMLTKNIVR